MNRKSVVAGLFQKKNGGNCVWLQFLGQFYAEAELYSYIRPRLKTVFLKVFTAKNRVHRGLSLHSTMLHLFHPFPSDVRIPREPKKTNTVVPCVGTCSNHTASRQCARAIVLSMTYAEPHSQMDSNFYVNRK